VAEEQAKGMMAELAQPFDQEQAELHLLPSRIGMVNRGYCSAMKIRGPAITAPVMGTCFVSLVVRLRSTTLWKSAPGSASHSPSGDTAGSTAICFHTVF
jgi:hypothetical protein